MLPTSSVLVFALTSGHAPSLTTLASASPSPNECRDRASDTSVWREARTTGLERYCDAVARSVTRLSQAPESALDAARAADGEFPGQAAPSVLAGRALLRLGRTEESVAAFERALGRDPRSIDSPAALWDYATALRTSGRLEGSLAAYRRLVPLSPLLPRMADTVRILLEAAHVSMALEGQRATADLREAHDYLEAARRSATGAARVEASLSLALVLVRQGLHAEADAVLMEQGGSERWAEWSAAPYLVDARDRVALEALSAERRSPERARSLHHRYLGEPKVAPPGATRMAERADRLAPKRPPARGKQ
jgi:tetratricopeptide (TPR) repeat protein